MGRTARDSRRKCAAYENARVMETRASYSECGVGAWTLRENLGETGPVTTGVDVVANASRVFRLLVPISIAVSLIHPALGEN